MAKFRYLTPAGAKRIAAVCVDTTIRTNRDQL